MAKMDEPRRDRWGRLAERLGLVDVRPPGLFARGRRTLAGERGGRLVAITPAQTVSEGRVDVLVRFPLGMTIRGFREDLLRQPPLLRAFGRKRRLPRSKRKRVYTVDGSVMVRLGYAVFPPSARRIERVLDGLIEAMGELVQTLDLRCEACQQDRNPDTFLVDGVPVYYCSACMERFLKGETDFEEQFRQVEPEYGNGTMLGLAAAAAFGIAGGALGAVAVILGGGLGHVLALPVFAVVGYLTSAIASRGFSGVSLGTVALKLPLVLASGAVGFTVMNAVATMTLQPIEWGLVLLIGSSWGMVRAYPILAAAVAGATAAGWIAESVMQFVGRRTTTRKTRVVRLEDPQSEEFAV